MDNITQVAIVYDLKMGRSLNKFTFGYTVLAHLQYIKLEKCWTQFSLKIKNFGSGETMHTEFKVHVIFGSNACLVVHTSRRVDVASALLLLLPQVFLSLGFLWWQFTKARPVVQKVSQCESRAAESRLKTND